MRQKDRGTGRDGTPFARPAGLCFQPTNTVFLNPDIESFLFTIIS
jgi:hypothetical protein